MLSGEAWSGQRKPALAFLAHFEQLERHIEDEFLDWACPGRQDSATTSQADFHCMILQQPSWQQHAGFSISGLADSVGSHYFVILLECLQSEHLDGQ